MTNSADVVIRVAKTVDVEEIMMVRLAVKENVLSNPDLVTSADCIEFLTNRGKGWVATLDGKVIGFAIVDLCEDNVWALFLLPKYEKRGIGKHLHDSMLDWYFAQGKDQVCLSTEPNTRAEGFYQTQGWTELGLRPNGEMEFEMRKPKWLSAK